MAKLGDFIWSLGAENIPLLFILLGAIMLAWIFFLGDMILPYIQ